MERALDIVVRCVSCVLAVADQWLISAEERSKHDMLFLQQNPAGGYLSGDYCLALSIVCITVVITVFLSVTNYVFAVSDVDSPCVLRVCGITRQYYAQTVIRLVTK